MTRLSSAVKSGNRPSQKEVCHRVSDVVGQHYSRSRAANGMASASKLLLTLLPCKSSTVLLLIYILSSLSEKHCWTEWPFSLV